MPIIFKPLERGAFFYPLILIMNNITNKELNNLYTAIFLLEHQRDQLEKSMPSDENEADISTFMLYSDIKNSIIGLKEVGKVLRDIRKSQATGYHA